MENFTWQNPVKLVFGRGTIGKLPELLPPAARILVTYGGGSIRANGVHEQVMAALKGRSVLEFGGIEPNPQYATCMKAVAMARRERIEFLLAVGGGSVLDGTKFIAAAVRFPDPDPWDILAKHAPVTSAVPLGCVLTLPATGSEMNTNSVMSRAETWQKLHFSSEHVYPRFSILDPETTYSLPPRQTANGIVDTMVHVFEQYLTRDSGNPLNEAFAEAILRVTIEYGRRVGREPRDYAVRANLMWAATMALNGLIGLNAVHDWTSHGIGHELTAFHGLDHGQSLAIVAPAVLRYKLASKRTMLARYARNVWGITGAGEELAAREAVDRTVAFWKDLGVKAGLGEYGIGADRFAEIADRLGGGGSMMGENGDIGRDDILAILRSCL